MSEAINDPEGPDSFDDLDAEYAYPSVERLLEIAASMDYYDVEHGVGTKKYLDLKDDLNLPEKYAMASALCDQFAQMEESTQDAGLTMMLYEGIIFKTMWDLRLQTQSKKRYKELSHFLMVGCGVMVGLAVYLLSHTN